jgi:hypothetical protein
LFALTDHKAQQPSNWGRLNEAEYAAKLATVVECFKEIEASESEDVAVLEDELTQLREEILFDISALSDLKYGTFKPPGDAPEAMLKDLRRFEKLCAELHAKPSDIDVDVPKRK